MSPPRVISVLALSASLLAQQAPPPPPPPPPPIMPGGSPQTLASLEGTGAISGVIVDGQSDRPLAGAVVILLSNIRGFSSQRQTTDEKGRFIFTKLPASDTFSVQATKIGFAEPASGRRVSLTEAQWVDDVKVPVFRLSSIAGTVTDEAGEPVIGAFVRVMMRVPMSGRTQLAVGPTVRTDDRGAYRVAGLQPGTYLVQVPSVQVSVPADTTDAALSGMAPEQLAQIEAAGQALQPRSDRTITPDGKNRLMIGGYVTPPPSRGTALTYPAMFHPSVRSVSDAGTIELARGEERGNVDVLIRPVPAVRVSGQVVAPTGAPVGGLTLRLMPAGLEAMSNGSEVATALTTADGSFTLLHVPAGEYSLLSSSSHMEYQTQTMSMANLNTSLPIPPGTRTLSGGTGMVASAPSGTNYSYRNMSGTGGYSGRASVSVGGSDVTNVTLSLKRGAILSGRVEFEEGTKPPVRPPTMTSVPVIAEPAFGDPSLGIRSGQLLLKDYTFTIEDLLPGQYVLRFIGLASAGGPKSIMWNGKDYAKRPLDLSDGQDATGVVVTMSDKVASLKGFVRDAKGQLATRGAVILFPADRTQWTGYGLSSSWISSTSLTTSGGYLYSRLYGGDYLLIAVDESLASAWKDLKFLEAAASVATAVTCGAGDSKVLDLTMTAVPNYKAGGRP